MLTVKCPQCSTALKLAQTPASGKVKCPKCATVLGVGKPAAVKAAPAAANRGAAARPAASRPAASRPAGTRPAGTRPAAGKARPASADPDDFDFGKISFPTAASSPAVSHFPSPQNRTAYTGPIPGDPLAEPEPEAPEPSRASQPPNPHAGPAKSKGSPMAVVRLLIGLALLMVCLILVVVVWVQRSNRTDPGGALLAAAQSTAPENYQAVGIQGCVALMPKGGEFGELPTVIEFKMVESDGSGSVYFLGAMNGGSRPIDKDQMRKKAEKQLGGEILGGNETERNGYKGIKGILDGSLFIPRMQVEVYHIEERFCIIGVAPNSMGADSSANVNRGLEREEETIFYESFKIGPKPAGMGWW